MRLRINGRKPYLERRQERGHSYEPTDLDLHDDFLARICRRMQETGE
jgi:hypothetical protein